MTTAVSIISTVSFLTGFYTHVLYAEWSKKPVGYDQPIPICAKGYAPKCTAIGDQPDECAKAAADRANAYVLEHSADISEQAEGLRIRELADRLCRAP